METNPLKTQPFGGLSDEQLFSLCQENDALRRNSLRYVSHSLSPLALQALPLKKGGRGLSSPPCSPCCQLAWLLDPDHDRAYVYRPGLPIETIASFDQTLSGEPVLPGFVFSLNTIR